MSTSFDYDTSLFLGVLPEEIRRVIAARTESLVEIIFDVGRIPKAVFFNVPIEKLSEQQVTEAQLKAILAKLGQFNDDNRAGIPGALHRVSCLRNRNQAIVGLTLRFGRAIEQSFMLGDLLDQGVSMLIVGPPGSGKTSILRQIAKHLASQASVMIVDTSNEIAGEGDVPHHAVGEARRIQVPQPQMQAVSMLEAVQNHTPDVVICDELGTKAQVDAAITISQRGVTLIATAHGYGLESIVNNPILNRLTGGSETVTLGDREAKKRRTAKTVQEQSHSSYFDVCVELLDDGSVAVHRNVDRSVKQILAGSSPQTELRKPRVKAA
ncbi:hypothetical protein BH10CYA1_BH10CYA1_53450 [soil metagenome]